MCQQHALYTPAMRNQPAEFPTDHRFIGAAATIAVHIALVLCWLQTRAPDNDADGVQAKAIQWIDVRPDKAVAVTPPAVKTEPVVRKKPSAPRMTLVKPALAVTPAAAPEEAPREPVVEAPPARSAYEMMQQARRDLGKIDKEINKALPERYIKKPLDTAQTRLEKGIELANELAPPKWYEAAKVKELIDPGGYGRRRYRVITAQGTFCMTYESAHSPDGRDQATRNTAPKMTNCPEHEEPAKAQKW